MRPSSGLWLSLVCSLTTLGCGRQQLDDASGSGSSSGGFVGSAGAPKVAGAAGMTRLTGSAGTTYVTGSAGATGTDAHEI